MPSDANDRPEQRVRVGYVREDNNFEQRLRDLYVELRSLRTIVDVLRDEIIKTNKRVQMLEGGVRPSLVPPHPEPEPEIRRAIKR